MCLIHNYYYNTLDDESAILSGLWGTLSHGVDQQWGYYLLVISRALIGIGEASFVPLSVTLIDDIATKEYKTTYM